MVNTAAFTTASYGTVAANFDGESASSAVHRAYPEGEERAFDTALDIARSACLIEHWEQTADGRSAVLALRQTPHGADVIRVALKSGCTNVTNADAFVTAVERGS